MASIASLAKPYRTHLVAWLTLSMAISVALAIPNWLLNTLLTRALPSANLRTWTELLILSCLARVAAIVLSATETWISARVSTGITRDIQLKLMSRAARMDATLATEFQEGVLTVRVVDGAEHVDRFLTTGLDLGGQVLLVTVIAGFLIHLSGWLGLLALLPVVPAVAVSAGLYGTVHRWWHRTWISGMQLRRTFSDYVVHQLTFQFFESPDRTEQRLFAAVRRAYSANLSTAIKAPLSYGLLSGITLSTTTVLWFVGTRRVMTHRIDLPTLVVFMAFAGQLYAPITTLGVTLRQLVKSLTSARDLFALERAMTDPATPHSTPHTLTGCAPHNPVLQCRDLSFAYSKRRPVLHNVTIEVPRGEVLGVIGATGAGKTTLGYLLAGIYTPLAGTVEVSGYPLADVRGELRPNMIGYVSQEAELIRGTVRDNISLGMDHPTPAAIVEAAQVAEAHAFICELPDGYDTDLGANGLTLSGGQRQRIALARALLRRPPVMVMDEATSGLDFETEAAVLNNLRGLSPATALIVITHRTNVFRPEDRVLVLAAGEIRTIGPYDDVRNKEPSLFGDI